MALDAALDKALKALAELNPYVTASKSGAEYEEGRFRLPFFNRTFLIHYPEIRVDEVGAQSPPPEWIRLLLFHYLLGATGVPVADDWIAYRDLPGAYLFEQRFRGRTLALLVRAFGNDIESFRKASLSLGGTLMTRTGDAAFRFLAFPQIPVACILYLGEEEQPPSINILFDAAAPSYLFTEDLSYVGEYLSLALRGYKGL